MTRKSLRELERLLRQLDREEVEERTSDSEPALHQQKALQVQAAKEQIEEEHDLEASTEELADAIVAATHQRLRSDGEVSLQEAVVEIFLQARRG